MRAERRVARAELLRANDGTAIEIERIAAGRDAYSRQLLQATLRETAQRFDQWVFGGIRFEQRDTASKGFARLHELTDATLPVSDVGQGTSMLQGIDAIAALTHALQVCEIRRGG